MSLEYSPRIITDGLVLCLDAFDIKSYPRTGTVWYDRSGNGNNGTLENGVGYNSDNGGILSFDGINDSVSLPFNGSFISNPSLNNMNMSVNFWCYVISSSSYYIVSSGAQTGSTGITFSYQAGVPFYGIKGANTQAFSNFNVSDFPLSTWINWCFTSDGVNFILYKNGIQLLNTPFTSGTFSDIFTNLTIGRPNNVFGYYANMKFPNISIYNKALKQQEIQQNFNATRGRYGI